MFNSTSKSKLKWLALKNIRLLNYKEDPDAGNQTLNEDDTSQVLSHIFEGSQFYDKPGYEKNETHFLTIHLGLIDRILKNSSFVNKEICRRDNLLSYSQRLSYFMDMLKSYFGSKNYDTFIAIHSGRSNSSKDIEKPLRAYRFISLSALESAFNNSKFQLTQLLYNTAYLGNNEDY